MKTIRTCALCHQARSLRHRFFHHMLVDVIPTLLMLVSTALLAQVILPR